MNALIVGEQHIWNGSKPVRWVVCALVGVIGRVLLINNNKWGS